MLARNQILRFNREVCNEKAHLGKITMILGIGSDLLDMRRIEKAYARFGGRFVQRLFTAQEQARAASRVAPALTYAKRFAAKEACAKALGTGIRQGVYFRDMGVVNLPSGQPTMVLTGGAKARFESMVPMGWRGRVHLSISDDYPMAQAFVILEAVRED